MAWLLTLLSVLQWSALACGPWGHSQAVADAGRVAIGAPDPGTSGPVAYAQLPAAPAVAEKRAPLLSGPAKGNADVLAVPSSDPPATTGSAPASAPPAAAPVPPRGEARILPQGRAPPREA